jgi:hypothetical protein
LQAAAVCQHLLASNFFECEESSEARKAFLKAGEYFSKLTMKNIIPFLNYLQELYNSLCVLFMEFENNQKGIGYAEKAEQLYHLI